jgi:hypothetical protein
VVILEGEEVCLAAWMHIMRVPETTFYHFVRYVAEKQVAQKHGNSCLFKPHVHTVQAIVIWRCILDKT